MKITTKDLLDAFDEAAQHHGIQQEHGFGAEAVRAEQAYNEAKASLVRRIKFLEKELKRRK